MALAILLCSAEVKAAPSVAHFQARVHDVLVDVVQIDLTDPEIVVRPLVLPDDGRKRASLWDFVRHHQPLAAINGTFFDTRTWRVTGNVVVDGVLVREGYVGNAIAFDRQNRPTIIHNTGRMGRHTDWSRFPAAMGGGPLLLIDGKLSVNPWAEGFRDPGLFRLTRRSAVGYNSNQKLLLVSARSMVNFHGLARIMQALGATNAISLDGGSSSALYYRGRVLAAPMRKLTNMLAIFEKATRPVRPELGANGGF
ncbi:MAG: phosphodiester glycosidase family protein [Armatimonadetes bacterium]|nr:phosphodiester glycosidase family protein [Armatimonadota bacterium]